MRASWPPARTRFRPKPSPSRRNARLGRVVDNAGKIVWLAGASGLVGGLVLAGLVESREYARILAITRRPLGREHPRLANRILSFAQLEAQLRGQSCDTALCCLGASADVLAFARAAKAAGARRFVIVSCHTADPAAAHAPARLQGEALEALPTMGFESLHILLPGPLLGLRRGAGVLQVTAMSLRLALRPLRFGASQGGRAIAASRVAAAVLAAARSSRHGATRHGFSGIVVLSRMRPRP
jgi:hypothetical protein